MTSLVQLHSFPEHQIERGYEDLASRLGRLGALIRTEEA